MTIVITFPIIISISKNWKKIWSWEKISISLAIEVWDEFFIFVANQCKMSDIVNKLLPYDVIYDASVNPIPPCNIRL